MTKDAALKKATRERMALTDEKYTKARRHVLADHGGQDGDAEVPKPTPLGTTQFDFEAGTLTAVVSGGGMTNLALIMPSLIRHVEVGRRLIVAPHEGRPEPWGLASPFDFAVASGAISSEELAVLWTSQSDDHLKELADVIERATAGIVFAKAPGLDSMWMSHLNAGEGREPSILYVPDLQVDKPLSSWISGGPNTEMSDFDLMPAQLTGLKSLARNAGAAVVGGHCMPTRMESGWRVVADIADETFTINEGRPSTDDGLSEATINRISYWSDSPGPHDTSEVVIDTRFSDWRNTVMRLRRK